MSNFYTIKGACFKVSHMFNHDVARKFCCDHFDQCYCPFINMCTWQGIWAVSQRDCFSVICLSGCLSCLSDGVW